MRCSICECDPCHSRCPNYEEPKAAHYCSICGNGIFENEEYVKNDDGEYRHWECFSGTLDLLEWLGYRIEKMEESGR